MGHLYGTLNRHVSRLISIREAQCSLNRSAMGAKYFTFFVVYLSISSHWQRNPLFLIRQGCLLDNTQLMTPFTFWPFWGRNENEKAPLLHRSTLAAATNWNITVGQRQFGQVSLSSSWLCCVACTPPRPSLMPFAFQHTLSVLFHWKLQQCATTRSLHWLCYSCNYIGPIMAAADRP